MFGRQKKELPPFDFARNRFPTRKAWPPNLREMTEKQQFRFERKFKRRIKLKSLSPMRDRYIKFTQWSLISFIVIYGVLFHDFAKDPMNPRPGEQVFEGVRSKMWGLLGNFYTHTEDNISVQRAGEGRLRREDRTKAADDPRG